MNITKIRGQVVLPLADRLRSLVEIDNETGCWNWKGTVKSRNRPYGRLVIGSRSDGSRKSVSAHRLSYETFAGEVPDDLCVCHHCDNPRCINPAHLFLGTKKENAEDRDRKGRLVKGPVLRGSAGTNAKLSEQQVAEIRASDQSSRVMSERFGVTSSHIRALRRGEYFLPAPPTETIAQRENEG